MTPRPSFPHRAVPQVPARHPAARHPTGRRWTVLALVLAAFAGLAAPAAGPARAGQDTPSTLFMLHCSGCHLPDGSGSVIGRIPPFPNIVGKHLHHRDGRLYLANVPGVINSGLPDEDTARLLNWVLDTWGGRDRPKDSAPFTGEEIGRLRGKTVDDIFVLRNRISVDLKRRGIDVGRYP
ncbi:c-type cytochrome [Prosthecodimorpha staleyi]|uniref:Cytochrome c n=1 Tax=Prosthecodimorpha staleyi TaxID=2840188 RepID=A0A947GEF5_9HYPH|nr:cytochrome c [Prosthecodimorpha staleyi]MBT9289310.1 cytochrome c [Prosthecodimorpha staleyi]